MNVDTVEEVDPRGTAASQTSQPGADIHKAPEIGTSSNGIRKMIPKCVSYIYIYILYIYIIYIYIIYIYILT